MPDALRLRDIRFTRASERDLRGGLVAYVSAALGPLRIDGITVRRTLDGRLVLSYPSRRDSRGREHPIIRPIGEAARREFECQIFEALGIREDTPP